jgi:hypothetical protein
MTAASGHLFSFSAAARSAALLRKLDAGASTRATSPIVEDLRPTVERPRTDDEILAHCAQLRAILAEARARRPQEKP